MTSTVSSVTRWAALLILLVAGLAGPMTARAQAPAEPGAYLVTYGPGTVYWEKFGHNAIWLVDPAHRLEHAFNFGFFDFEQENFLLRFVQGRMLYFGGAVPIERELEFYRGQGRSIRMQKLDLSEAEYARLRDHLLESVKPENRDYLYDYFLDNCSTRLRDALDVALDGAVLEQFEPQPALLNWRDHVRRSVVGSYFYYLGLETGLGSPIDRKVSRWDEMFLPAMLADSVSEITRLETNQLRNLVASDQYLATSKQDLSGLEVPVTWPSYLLLGVLVAGVLLILNHWAPAALGLGFPLGWVLINASLGLGLAGLWLATDHQAAWQNANLLLLNPVFIIGLWPSMRRVAAGLLVLGGIAALVIGPLLEMQYLSDVLASVGLINAAVAVCLWRSVRV